MSDKNLKKSKTEVVSTMYIGPTIPGVVRSNTIFSNGISPELQIVTEEIPAIKELIIPIDKLVAARSQLNDLNSGISICYTKVLNYSEKGD